MLVGRGRGQGVAKSDGCGLNSGDSGGRCAQLYGKSSRLVRAKVRNDGAICKLGGCVCERLLLGIQFARAGERRGKADAHAGLRFSVELHQPDDDLVRGLSPLDRHHANARV